MTPSVPTFGSPSSTAVRAGFDFALPRGNLTQGRRFGRADLGSVEPLVEEVDMTRARGALFVNAVAALLYLGLAVLGRGGIAAFFAQPALSTVAVATILLCVVGLLSEGNINSGERENRGNRSSPPSR